MDYEEKMAGIRDAITVQRVYGDPYERDGVVVIPAAKVRGGGGGGGGEGPQAGQTGSGAGFGLEARPVGAYVIENGNVRWEPAIDVGRILAQVTIAVLGLAFLLRRRG
jgi:uncharacterized spore protein YtfJ